jgi:hypothetical protein
MKKQVMTAQEARNRMWDGHQHFMGQKGKPITSPRELTVGRNYLVMVFGYYVPARYAGSMMFRIYSREHALLSVVKGRPVSLDYSYCQEHLDAKMIHKFKQKPQEEPTVTETKAQSIATEEAREAAIKHPKHYNLFADDSLESIDAIRVLLTPEEFKGFLKGNVLKYRFRAGGKDDTLQDIGKAKQYNSMLAKYVAERETF